MMILKVILSDLQQIFFLLYNFAEMAFLLTKVLSIVRPTVRPYGIHVTYESGFSLQYSSIPFWVQYYPTQTQLINHGKSCPSHRKKRKIQRRRKILEFPVLLKSEKAAEKEGGEINFANFIKAKENIFNVEMMLLQCLAFNDNIRNK